MAKYLDENGLLYFWQQLKTMFAGKVDVVSGKGLSTNDYTTTEKNKLSGIASGAEVNQNAFANVAVGSTTIAADAKQDTLTLEAGDNITLTPNATTDKITIAAAAPAYSGTSPISVSGSSISHDASGVTAASKGDTANQTPGFGGTFKVPSGTVNATGHLTAFADHTVTIPSTEASTTAAGLMSSSDKSKLNGIDDNAEVNVIEGVTVNGTAAPITSKIAAITVPTKTSDLTNDSNFITSEDVPEGAAASTVTPIMDGTAAKGTDNGFARGDHVHPTDTTRQAKITVSGILKGNGNGGVSAAVAGTDYAAASHTQALSTITGTDDLQAIEALSGTSGILKKTAANTWALDTTSYLSTSTADSTYAKKTDISGAYIFKGSVASYADLPSTGITAGDVYNVEATDMNYAWTGTAWDQLGSTFTITSISNAEIDAILAA